MARTLIGQLILRLQAQGLNQADRVVSKMRDVENAARRLGAGGVGSWGVGFQRQLDRLRLTANEIGEVQKSWIALHDSMRKRGLDTALRGAEISHWKTQTVSTFAQMRGEVDNHLREVEKKARAHADRMSTILRPGLVMLGAYTAPYFAGVMGMQAFTAASEEHRARADAKFAGLSQEERDKIEAKSDELSAKYRLPKSVMLNSIKDSSLNMPSTDAALEVADAKARAVLVMASQPGNTAQGAVDGLRRFDRAMDNIERVEPEEYLKMLDGFIKMQQIIGPDMDPSQYEQAVKYSRTAGKVHNDEFLTQWLPLLLSAVGGRNAGTMTRSFFDQFLIGRAPKAALKEQERYGIRGADGRLIGQDAFGENPIKWIYDYLLPQLEKMGVDTEDKTELARVIGTLTNNRTSSDLISSAIISMDQWTRILEERLPNAYGLNAADEVQDLNPFAAWDGFKAALENLSGALLPMEQISAGLNALADGINTLAAAARENPLGVAFGMGAAGFGAYKGTGYLFNKATDMFGLKGSALALDGSAAALTRAAVALHGSAAADGVGDASNAKKGKGAFPLTSWLATFIAALSLSGSTPKERNSYTSASPEERERMRAEARRHYEEYRNRARDPISDPSDDGGRAASLNAFTDGPTALPRISVDSENAKTEVEQLSADMAAALEVKAKPLVDSSSIDAAIAKARQLLSVLTAAAGAARTADANAAAELRRNFSD